MRIPSDWNPTNPLFREFYGWDDTLGQWNYDLVETKLHQKAAVHYFINPYQGDVKGTLFIIHGYLEHTALRIPIIAQAVRHGWMVCGIDLIGHGLSTGKPAHIDEFDEYVVALETALHNKAWPKPWRFAGHSTGCAVELLYVAKHGNPFEWSLLEAPLVRTMLWKPSMVAKRLFKGAINTLPRRNAGMSKKQTYYGLLKRDPLYLDKVPISWFDALERYVAVTESWSRLPGSFLILQGDMDTGVDWPYNVEFLQNHIEQPQIEIIRGGKHHLLRDEGPSGDQARRVVLKHWYGMM